jgi:hypothetical protein
MMTAGLDAEDAAARKLRLELEEKLRSVFVGR